MGANTKIEWCDHTWNPWRGCTKVSAGCDNCYAEMLSKRNPGVLGVWGPNGTRVVASRQMWRQPYEWNVAAADSERLAKETAGDLKPHQHVRPRVFCASLADVFEDFTGPMVDSKGERLKRPDESDWLTMADVRRRLFRVIDETEHLDWLLLTKRPENVLQMLPENWLHPDECKVCGHKADADGMIAHGKGCYAVSESYGEPGVIPDNVWIGASVENQAMADERIPHLLRIPAAVRFLSCEPLLGPVELQFHPDECPACGGGSISGMRSDPENDPFQWYCTGKKCGDNYALPGIDWVIAGGESGNGPNIRPCHPDCIRSLRDQCQAAGVPYFFKQWGEFGTDAFNMRTGEPVFREFGTFEEWVNKAASWVNGGVCLDRTGKRLEIGKDFMAAREEHRFPVTVMHRVGKKAAGRMLDGREWSEFPYAQ